MENKRLRNIPSVNDVLEDKRIRELLHDKGRCVLKDFIISSIKQYRNRIILDDTIEVEHNVKKEAVLEIIVRDVVKSVKLMERKRVKKVINATGIILHTNMGRAPLPKRAIDKIREVAGGYSNLEYDLTAGRRGSRYDSVEELLTKITGAESALVVNNNAAAVFICLNTLALDKEVIVSRSEQIEIGGSFRIPEIVERSGSRMVEVGTTNKTYIKDYSNAISEDTRLLLKVHKSNYRIEGFTCDVQGGELAKLATKHQIVTMEDLGSGVLLDLQSYHLPYEPTVMDQINNGLDIVTFSGDKLLGGPQAGIIVGRKELIDRIKRNPLTRMVRIDKLSLIALQEVLSIYMEGNNVTEDIPILNMLTKNQDSLNEEANKLIKLINEKLGNKVELTIEEETDTTGGGSLPGVIIKGIGVAVKCNIKSANLIQQKLRFFSIPIICKIRDNCVIFSMRTIAKEDYMIIANGLTYAVSSIDDGIGNTEDSERG